MWPHVPHSLHLALLSAVAHGGPSQPLLHLLLGPHPVADRAFIQVISAPADMSEATSSWAEVAGPWPEVSPHPPPHPPPWQPHSMIRFVGATLTAKF